MFTRYLVIFLLIHSTTGKEKPPARHTVWIPAGRRIYLPCNLNDTVKVAKPSDWARLNRQLSWKSPSTAVTTWHNSQGKLIHVGEILLIYIPPFEASELPITQFVPRQTAPHEKPMSLSPEYKNWVGGTHQLLHVNHLETITCTVFKSSTFMGKNLTWNFPNRRQEKLSQSFFTFRIYAQPILIWNYAIPPDLEYIEREVLLNLTTLWCSQHSSIKWHVLSICDDIFEERKPLVKLTNPTDKIPMLSSSDPGYIEIGIAVNIKNKPLHLLADPTNGQLSYLHAEAKDSLDRYILNGTLQNLIERGIENPVRIATRIQAICPPGSHTFMHVPALQNLYYRPDIAWNITYNPLDVNTPLAHTSAGALVSWSIICHPCPDGQAPRTPYAFDDCHYCPRGYYLGGTGWPSSAGCLRCPKGYSTDRVGATSQRDCMLDAGAVTRTGFGYLLDFWFRLKRSMVGMPGPETNTRALSPDQQSAWAWLGRIGATPWIWTALYTLFVTSIIALATYRLHLYYKLKSIFKKRYNLLLKIAIIGQINLISRIKQQRKIKGLD